MTLSTLVALSATLAAFDAAAAEPTHTVPATIRDFARGDTGGHPDFNTTPDSLQGRRTGAVERELSADRRPVFATVRPAQPSPYTSEANFDQWYRDVPGVNHTIPIELGFGPRADDPSILTTEGYNSNHFARGSFFPIDGLGFGNEGHPNNYGFTTHFAAEFSYIAGSTFTFSGDDDVWAFINGRLAIDLSGVHRIETTSVTLLDGRMFVELDKIPAGGQVQPLDAADASRLQTDWTRLGMSGSLPVQSGTHGSIDLGLGIVDDSRCVFDPSGLAVEVYTAGPPPAEVRLILVSGRADARAWAGNGATYAVTQQPITGVEIVAADGAAVFFSPAGRGNAECQLDFFHAERQFSQSQFRIDTTLLGQNEANIAFTGYD